MAKNSLRKKKESDMIDDNNDDINGKVLSNKSKSNKCY